MIPIGYMYKEIKTRPDWLNTHVVKNVYSVSGCISADFTDWMNYWKHNGYWFFNSPQIMETLARENNINLSEMKLFYYEAFEMEWDEDEWRSYEPEKSFETAVELPKNAVLFGFDVVSFFTHTSAECSPLSCNNMAETIVVNEYCLLRSLDEAKRLIESGAFKNCEPGPYRIFGVYGVQ